MNRGRWLPGAMGRKKVQVPELVKKTLIRLNIIRPLCVQLHPSLAVLRYHGRAHRASVSDWVLQRINPPRPSGEHRRSVERHNSGALEPVSKFIQSENECDTSSEHQYQVIVCW